MKIPVAICCILLCLMQHLYAQNEGNIWYFGSKAGLDFNSGSPVALTDGQLKTDEGCATMADKNGRLLFYTDGVFVWNKLHKIMPNGTGLKGHASSTQSAVVVPFPKDTAKYYVFTVDYEGNANGLQYSIVDMTKDNGNGEIIKKNNKLEGRVCEKLTAVQHKNRTDIWVIVHLWESRKFAAFLVTEKGINPPVYSEIGIYYGGTMPENSLGYMKASPDGKRLASAYFNYKDGSCQVFDFNNENGELSNPVLIQKAPWAYGIEFSSNSKMLYVGIMYNRMVYQYDVSAKDTADIKNNGYEVANTSGLIGALQLGPDEKIYVAEYNKGILHSIDNPNAKGSHCNFVKNAVYLKGRICLYGLPTFIQSSFQESLRFFYSNQCAGNSTTFEGFSDIVAYKWEWSFGDTVSGENNISLLQNPNHIFLSPGVYKVKLKVTSFSKTDSIIKEVIIYPTPLADLGHDKEICNTEEEVTLTIGEAENYKWSTGETTQQITVSTGGTYWVEIKNGSCIASDTINIKYIVENDFELGDDIVICEREEIILGNNLPNADFTWNTGSKAAKISVNKAGRYWLKTILGNCAITDTINVDVLLLPDIKLGNDTTICEGEEITIGTELTKAKLEWSSGESFNKLKIKTSGKYWLTASNGKCFSTDTINVIVQKMPFLNLGNDTFLCEDDEILLQAQSNGSDVFWSTGESTQTITIRNTGKYWGVVKNGNCIATDTITLYVCEPKIFVPNAFSPDDNSANDYFRVYASDISTSGLLIYNRWGECIFEATDVNSGWDGRFKNELCPADRYLWIFRYRGKNAPRANYKQLSGSLHLLR